MGQLADTARKNSNFLKLAKGETIIVEYMTYRIIPSTMDPTKESIQYRFNTPHGEKFWTNGNAQIMMFFDELSQGTGTKVKITRRPWVKDGVEDPSKSMYDVGVV